jgi:hypothetical protein
MHEQNNLTPMFNVGDRATLQQVEHAHVRYWVEEMGSQKEAASILDIHPGALSRKISDENIRYIKKPKRAGKPGHANPPPDPNPPYARQEGAEADAASDDGSGSTDD